MTPEQAIITAGKMQDELVNFCEENNVSFLLMLSTDVNQGFITKNMLGGNFNQLSLQTLKAQKMIIDIIDKDSTDL